MAEFPAAAAERRHLRERLTAGYVPAARPAAMASRMTFHCAGVARTHRVAGEVRPHPWHATEAGGCKDPGTGCLCPCHDEELQ